MKQTTTTIRAVKRHRQPIYVVDGYIVPERPIELRGLIETRENGEPEFHFALAFVGNGVLTKRALAACGRTFEDADDWMRSAGSYHDITCPECARRRANWGL